MDALINNADLMRRLRDVSPELTEEYRKGWPFPHVALDDFLPPDVLEDALAHFPKPGDLTWQKYNNPNEVKLAFREIECLPQPLRDLLVFLNSRPMLTFVEKLTGIPALVADMSYVG